MPMVICVEQVNFIDIVNNLQLLVLIETGVWECILKFLNISIALEHWPDTQWMHYTGCWVRVKTV